MCTWKEYIICTMFTMQTFGKAKNHKLTLHNIKHQQKRYVFDFACVVSDHVLPSTGVWSNRVSSISYRHYHDYHLISIQHEHDEWCFAKEFCLTMPTVLSLCYFYHVFSWKSSMHCTYWKYIHLVMFLWSNELPISMIRNIFNSL